MLPRLGQQTLGRERRSYHTKSAKGTREPCTLHGQSDPSCHETTPSDTNQLMFSPYDAYTILVALMRSCAG
jgi:hypothetical protein